MDWHRRGWISAKGRQDNVVLRPIALLHSQERMATPFPCHGHTRRLGSRLFVPDWRLIEAASDEKRVYSDGLAPAVAETLGVDQALSVLCAAVDRVRLVIFLFEYWQLAVLILRQTRRVQCQDWLRAVRAGVRDPVGCPSYRLRLRSLQTLRLLLLLLQTRLRPLRRRRRRRIRSGVHGSGLLRAV